MKYEIILKLIVEADNEHEAKKKFFDTILDDKNWLHVDVGVLND